MGFIHSLQLNTRLIVLYMLIGVGLILVGIVGYINISAMKKNLDDLYFGSFVPVNELNELLYTYHSSVESTVFKLTDGTLSPFEASSTLSESLDKVQMIWKNYASHYKSSEEQQYVNYASATLNRADRHIQRVIDVCHQGINVSRISSGTTSQLIMDVDRVIQKLLKYEKEVAYLERRKLLVTYENTIIQLVIILGVITGAVLWVSYAIFSSIRRQQAILENTTENLKAANTKLEDASYTDSLTTLHNRRYFNMIFDRELKRAKRAGSFFSFMMLDIDNFKQYNDTYGHLEGDTALKAVSSQLKECLQRPGDFVFRLGGEEFGILVTESTPESAKKTAEMICTKVEALELPHEANDASEFVTVSIGAVSLVPSVDLDENIILSMADSNLYEAKENGRNDVVFTTERIRTSAQNPHRSRVGAA
ncbi:MAG: diguanylate cyclase [Sulfurimonadaceae bacterium]|nr:diguanylate cyclase [Sulfurimonadaceae bacterium]